MDGHDVGVIEMSWSSFAGRENFDLDRDDEEGGETDVSSDLYWWYERSIRNMKPFGGGHGTWVGKHKRGYLFVHGE